MGYQVRTELSSNWLVGSLFCFTAYQPFSGYLMPIKSFWWKFQTIQLFVYTQLNVQTVLFQTIQLSISINFCLHSVKCKNSQLQTIQFSVITQFSSIWPIGRTLSGATTPGQSGPGSNSNEGTLSIPQSSSITEARLSDCLVSYQDIHWRSLTPLQRCSQCILQPQLTGPGSNWFVNLTY